MCTVLVNSAPAQQLTARRNAPILFEPITDAGSATRFAAAAHGYRVLFEPGRAVFLFGSHQASMTFACSAPSSITGESRATAVRNYYRGGDVAEGVPTFERIHYRRVLPGIDMIFYGRGDSDLEFDLVLSPGADPGLIELQYDGFRSVRVSSEGDLLLETPAGLLKQELPDVTQAGRRIPTRYVMRGRGVGIALDPYDIGQALLIDPRISYATYLGGSRLENTQTVVIDADGNYYVAANTTSQDYPRFPVNQIFPGDFDIVVSKFSAKNTLLYSTVIGGTLADAPGRVAVDSDGSLFVSFISSSTNFPKPPGSTLGGGAAGAGVLKLSPAGTLTAVAFISPSTASGPYDLTIDADRNVWITGGTTAIAGQTGAIQATVAGGVDILVARLNNSITQITYLTYLGTAADEVGNRIAVDASESVYILGVGGSASFPTGPSKAFPGAGSFLVKLDPVKNRILFATHISGSKGGGYGLALDANAVWAGVTSDGTNFTPTPDASQAKFGGGFNDAILVRLSATDGKIGYATYFGGSGAEFANDLVQDPYGNLMLYGNTTSTNLPVTADALRPSFPQGSISTAYIAVMDAGGRLTYASYLGGSGPYDLGLGLAVNRLGNAMGVGATTSADFPVTADAFQRRIAGDQDVYIAKLEFVSETDPSLPRVAIQNGASFQAGPVAPGELIAIYPRNVGPAELTIADGTVDSVIPTLLGGTRVLFDGIAAPVASTVNGVVGVIVPYEVEGKAYTRVVVEYNGVKSRPVAIPVAATAPGILTTGNGAGPAVVINETGDFNSPDAPADRGSLVVFYFTGEGQTTPPGVTGQLNAFTNLEDVPLPVAAVTVTIGGQPAEIVFGTAVPGLTPGLRQIKVRVPQDVEPGAAPVAVTIGGVASAPGVTISVQ